MRSIWRDFHFGNPFVLASFGCIFERRRAVDQHQQPYTLGIWKVKPGNEENFLSQWKAFAIWTSQNQPEAGTGCLLRDLDDPQKFISFGPWRDSAAIDRWRSTPEFRAFVGRVKALCEGFEPHSMEVVAIVN
jgi:quinol monooxygenase YgiN